MAKREVIVSGKITGNQSTQAEHLNRTMAIDKIPELQVPYEEADMRLIPHIQYGVTKFSRTSVTVISDDTDVLILLLFYFKDFNGHGLQNLFLLKGRGDN